MPIHSRQAIDSFLSEKRLALIGVSRKGSHFSRRLYEELLRRDYDVLPVHPSATDIDGRPCYSRIGNIEPVPAAALVMTAASRADAIVEECVGAGVRKVWLYRAVGQGAVSPTAVEHCLHRNVEVIAGECPFMFLPETQWFHRMHGLVRKISGSYPG